MVDSSGRAKRPAPAKRPGAGGRPLGAWRIPAAIIAAFVVVGVAYGVFMLSGGSGGDPGPKTYSDPEFGFTFQYPDAWKATKRSGSAQKGGALVSVVDPKGGKTKSGYVDSATVAVAWAGPQTEATPGDAGVASSIADLKASFPDVALTGPLHAAAIGAKSGWSWSYTYTQETVPVKVSFYWLVDGNTAYGVTFKSSAEHEAADAAVFSGILSSFTFPSD